MRQYVELDPRIRCAVKDLLDEPVVVTVNEFTEESAHKFRDQFARAHEINQPIIPVLIDSYGGEIYSLMSMISTIKHSDIPVATVVDGKAMSCGAILFSFGSKGHRYMDDDATLMIHHVSLGAWNKIHEVEARAAHGRLLNNRIYKMMAENCEQPDQYFIDLVEKHKSNADWYLTAKMAKKHKLANKLFVPKLRTKVSVEIAFG
jgi:ATP-dependent protease ClpP protease subunit